MTAIIDSVKILITCFCCRWFMAISCILTLDTVWKSNLLDTIQNKILLKRKKRCRCCLLFQLIDPNYSSNLFSNLSDAHITQSISVTSSARCPFVFLEKFIYRLNIYRSHTVAEETNLLYDCLFSGVFELCVHFWMNKWTRIGMPWKTKSNLIVYRMYVENKRKSVTVDLIGKKSKR